jgi:orotate phosphoribosyltransferase
MQRDRWDEDTARIVAKILLDIEAVNIRADEPYTLTSGWKSPVYVDCRKIIFFPRARQKIVELAAEQIGRHFGFETIEAVAGGETAGIPYAAWLADKLMAPMAYIRKKPKGFGRNAQIEGAVPEGMTTLLVEDLTTDGGSKVAFAKVLRDAGAICRHAFVVFYYGVFPGAAETMRDIGLDLLHLCQWEDVLSVCEQEGGRFPPQALQTARQFLADPMAWSAARGGVGSAEEAAAYKAAKG